MRSQVFEDFDAFAESVRDVDSRMMLRNPKQRVWSIDSVNLDGIDVQVGQLGSGNIAQGQLRPDGFMIYLPLTDGVEYFANGRPLNKSSFAILEPGCEFCISTKVEHDWCVAFVPTHILAQGSELSESPWGLEKRQCRVTGPAVPAANQFREIVHQIMFAAATCSEFESARAAKCAASELLKIASSVVGQHDAVEPSREGRPALSRQEIIRTSLEFLEEHHADPIRVGEMAAAANVSERTLRTAFQDYFAIGPVRYLQFKRLHEIHRVLRAADPDEVTVAKVLAEHGEWAFSRFASRYRQLFGELPSQTLRAKRR